MSIDPNKYTVYKTEDLVDARNPPLDDCVVIRLQDPYAAASLDMYANTILAALDTVDLVIGDVETIDLDVHDHLIEVAEYFQVCADRSRKMQHKVPD